MMDFVDWPLKAPTPDVLTDGGWICPTCEHFLSVYSQYETRVLRYEAKRTIMVIACPNGCRPESWIPAEWRP